MCTKTSVQVVIVIEEVSQVKKDCEGKNKIIFIQ